jgi:hypothetical protein
MILIDHDGITHDIAGEPDPDCYGCLGTGILKGFGVSGTPCHCKYNCERHEQACLELIEGE